MQTSKVIALKLISAPPNQVPISVARNGEFTVKWQRKEGMSESLSSSWSVGWVPVQKGQQQSHSSLVGQTLAALQHCSSAGADLEDMGSPTDRGSPAAAAARCCDESVILRQAQTPVGDVGSLQQSQGRQHLTQEIPDDLLALGLLPQRPPPGTGLHHRGPLQYELPSLQLIRDDLRGV
ncbi:MAG: hypothetical protein FRX49_09440 [Trebouxia sp. A1-2]|nr:MAG: hypothetical protein FRX49_09440 [Trebouxia sp. A1-2]